MKIGAVCEQTGLTDRTVRYYTEEGLLSPSYTKNYLGRKTFDFTEADVAMLRHIAVLRKYGFAIPEIKSILEDPSKSVAIIEALRQKKQDAIRLEQELLDGLLTLETGRQYTVPELAQALNTPKLEETKLPEEPNDGCFLTSFRLLFWLLCCPQALTSILILWEWNETFLYKKYYPIQRAFLLGAPGLFLPILCAFAMVFLEMKRVRKRRTVWKMLGVCLAAFYVLYVGTCHFFLMFFGAVFPPCYSETENPAHYMRLGLMETQKMGNALDLLFPDQVPEYALEGIGYPTPETTRYYNYVGKQWDNEFELYAQWQLTEHDLAEEKARIRAELGELITTEGQLGRWEYWSFKIDPALWFSKSEDYVWESSERICLFFAYDDETGIVRYIASYSDNYMSEPGFCSLDWD